MTTGATSERTFERRTAVSDSVTADAVLEPSALSQALAGGFGPSAKKFRRPTRDTWRRAALVAADVVSATTTLAVIHGAFDNGTVGNALIGAPLVILLCKLAGLYDHDQLRFATSTLDEAPMLLKLSGLFVLGITIGTPVLNRGNLHGGEVAALWVTLFISLTCGRAIARSVTARLAPFERCLAIGDLDQATLIHDRLEAEGKRARVIAVVPLDGGDVVDFTKVGMDTKIRELVVELNADRIIIAPGDAADDRVADLIRIARAVGVRVSVLPGSFNCLGSRFAFEEINGLWLLGVRPFGLSPASWLLKRNFDLIAATFSLIVLGPLIAIIAVAIRLDSKGPVFFKQVRVGRDGKHFRMIKFRSMAADAEARKDELRALSEAGEGLFKITDDPRVTAVGRFLRRSSLDEIPQLLNVIRGEMSLVGPRPLVVEEDAGIVGIDRSRLHLPPGMTGPWQVLRRRVSRPDMIEIDYRYAAGWSLWLDVKILLRTVLHVARRGNH